MSSLWDNALSMFMPHTTIPAAFFERVPSAMKDDPFGYAISLSGMMIVTLIFLAGVHMSALDMIERPEKLHHPRTVDRLLVFLTCLSGVLRNGPDVLVRGLWKGVQPVTRWEMSHWNQLLDGVSAPIMVGTAMLYIASRSVKSFQLGREPLPVELYLSARKLARPFVMVVIACVLSFLIAFME
jgi:hypothetical protein